MSSEYGEILTDN